MQTTVKDLLTIIHAYVSNKRNHGYSNQQTAIRQEHEHSVRRMLDDKFPDIKDDLTIANYHGCGYYSCYSDFAIQYKHQTLIGIGNHTSTVQAANYRAELDIHDLKEICQEFEIKDFEALTLDEAVDFIKRYHDRQRAAQIRERIADDKEDIRRLEAELKTLNLT